MTEKKSGFEAMKDAIEQLRDEIKLKAHLGKAEARDELEKIDKKWQDLQDQYKPVADEAGKTAGKVADKAAEAFGQAADELKAGYERIRKLF